MDLKLALVLEAVDKMTAPLGRAWQQVQTGYEKVTKLGDRWKATGEQISQAGEKLSAFAAKTQAIVADVMAPAQELESALADLGAALPDGLLKDKYDTLRDAALDWSKTHTQSATDFVKTAQMLRQAGVSEAEAIAATQAALTLATAAKTDGAAAARTLGVVYSQMGDRTRPVNAELARLGDVLTRAKQLFPTIDVGALTDPLKDAIPAAKSAGVSFEQLVATLGAFNKAGLQGGEAGAKLRSLMAGLAPAAQKLGFTMKTTASGGLDLVGTLQAIEAKYGSLATMSPETRAQLEAAFGPEVWGSLALLLGQTADLDKALKGIEGSAGAAANAQKLLESTSAAEAKMAEQAMAAAKVELAAGLAPVMREVATITREAATAFGAWARENPELVATLGKVLVVAAGIAAVAGPLLVAGGAAVSFAGFLVGVAIPALVAATAAAWGFAVALLANPITWVVLAIVAAAALIYIYWEPIREFFIDLWNDVTDAFLWAADVATRVWDAAAGELDAIFGEIGDAFQESFVLGIFTAMRLLQPAAILGRIFGAVGLVLADVWADIRTAIHATTDQIHDDLAGWWRGVLDDAFAAGDELRAGMADAWDGLRADAYAAGDAFVAWLHDTFVGGIERDVEAVRSVLANFSLRDAGANIVNTLVDGMRTAANAPAEAMSGIVQKVRDYLPFSPAKEGPLRDLHRIRLVETVAESVKPGPLVEAMSNVTSAAYTTLTDGPTYAPIPATTLAPREGAARPSPPSAPSTGAPPSLTVVLQIQGGDGGPVDAIERWLRSPENARRLYRAAQVGAGLEQRTEFG